MANFEVNDRVSRQIEIGKPARKTGTIVIKYKSSQGTYAAPYWLYAIRWDGVDQVERGHLEQGLEKLA